MEDIIIDWYKHAYSGWMITVLVEPCIKYNYGACRNESLLHLRHILMNIQALRRAKVCLVLCL